jgi:hypothetical protein
MKNIIRKRGNKNSKGQIFIIASIFMLVGLVLMFNLLGTPQLSEEKKFQETRILNENARNLMNEYFVAAGLVTDGTNITATASQYFSQLSALVRNDFDSRVLYALVFVNGSTQRYHISIGNQMNDRINLTVNTTNPTSESNFAIADRGTAYLELSGLNGTTNMTLIYTLGNSRTTEKLSFNITEKNYVQAFFDLSLRNNDFLVRIKDTYGRTW